MLMSEVLVASVLPAGAAGEWAKSPLAAGGAGGEDRLTAGKAN